MILDAITNKTQNVHFTIPSPSSEKPLAEVDQLKTPTLVMTSLIRHFKNILLRPLLFGQSTEFIRLDQIFLSLSVNNLEVNYCLNKENMNAEADRKFLKWHVLAYYLIILAVYATTNKYRSAGRAIRRAIKNLKESQNTGKNVRIEKLVEDLENIHEELCKEFGYILEDQTVIADSGAEDVVE